MRLLTRGLAAWRLSRMLVFEDGPGRVFFKLREATGIEHDPNGGIVVNNDWNPLHCVYCTSVYTAVLVSLLPDWACDALAVAGIAAAIESYHVRRS